MSKFFISLVITIFVFLILHLFQGYHFNKSLDYAIISGIISFLLLLSIHILWYLKKVILFFILILLILYVLKTYTFL